MQLKAGQTVADIGAGTGLLSVPVAKAVGPRGRVFAVEIDPGSFRRSRSAETTMGSPIFRRCWGPSRTRSFR
jgi:precorrin-6B methylase 2